MGKIKRVIAIVMIGLLTLSISGCATFDNFKDAFIDKNTDDDDVIRIGIYEPVTGADSEAASAEIEGIKLAHKLYPKVLGKEVELVYADNNSDIDAAETAIADLMKKKPLVVLGSYGSIYSLVASKYLKAAGIPGISITNTNPLVTSNNPYYFRVCPVETYQGEALARYVFKALNQKKTAIMIPKDSEQATAIASAYRDKFEAITKNEDALAAYEEYKPGDKVFVDQLQSIKKSGTKTVFLTGELDDVTLILQQAERMKLKVFFLGDSNWASEEFTKQANRYKINKIVFSTLYNENQTVTPMAEKFLAAYGSDHDTETVEAAALGFDAYLIARNAIEKAGAGSSSKQIKEAISKTKDFSGASGKITFTPIGDPEKTVVINTIKNNQLKPIYRIDPVKKKPDQKTKEDFNGTED